MALSQHWAVGKVKTLKVPADALLWYPQQRRVNGKVKLLWPFRLHLTDAQMKLVKRHAAKTKCLETELVQNCFNAMLESLVKSGPQKLLAENEPTSPTSVPAGAPDNFSAVEISKEQIQQIIKRLPPSTKTVFSRSINGIIFELIKTANGKGRTVFDIEEFRSFTPTPSTFFTRMNNDGQIHRATLRTKRKKGASQTIYRLIANPNTKFVNQKKAGA